MLELPVLELPEELLPPEERVPPEERLLEAPEERELPTDEDRGEDERLELPRLELGARALGDPDLDLPVGDPTREVEVRGIITGDDPPVR